LRKTLLKGIFLAALAVLALFGLLEKGGFGAETQPSAAPAAAPRQSAPPERVLVALERPAPAPQAGLEESAPPQAEARAPEPILHIFDTALGKSVEMGLEDYVLHTLAGEMPAGYEPEALKAQAVAIRSYALWKSRAYGGGGCAMAKDADLCTSSSHCAAFASDEKMRKNFGTQYEEKLAKLRLAVEETQGLCCAYEGEAIQALFHSSSGGQTEDSAAVFAQALPYLSSVKSPGEEQERDFRSSLTLKNEELAQKLNAAFPGAKLEAAKLQGQIEILGRSASGRVLTLRLGEKQASGKALRGALGLKSTNFTLKFGSGELRFEVLGFGHGVGLSQTGAEAMAKSGAGFREILSHYYQGVEILPLSKLE
jgi:stage II sporulation protein D